MASSYLFEVSLNRTPVNGQRGYFHHSLDPKKLIPMPYRVRIESKERQSKSIWRFLECGVKNACSLKCKNLNLGKTQRIHWLANLQNKSGQVVTNISLERNQQVSLISLTHRQRRSDRWYIPRLQSGFDTISHDIFFSNKLVIHSLDHSAVKWLKSRNQRIAINAFFSSWGHLSSGVHP